MRTIKSTSLAEFYEEASGIRGQDVSSLLPPGINKEIGHFNVFDIANTLKEFRRKAIMPYNRRSYYKISLIKGKNRAEYADRVIDIRTNALLFATPKVPYRWLPQDENQSGSFCVFTSEFLAKNRTGIVLDDLPIFKPGGYPVFEVSTREVKEISAIFSKMAREITSDYVFKYDLLRNYVIELIHYGQKLQPVTSLPSGNNPADRVSSLFVELLERQFPIESPHQRLLLRTAKDYADRLSIHVNHLNRVLKETTGSTTTKLLSNRLTQEAKILLKQTDWNISEIAFSLGFAEVAHFSNFFKKQTTLTPLAFRS